MDFQSGNKPADSLGKPDISETCGANAGAVETKTTQIPSDLQALIDAWPALPNAMRAGIVAMVKAAAK